MMFIPFKSMFILGFIFIYFFLKL
uniref:Uncharacterized protein n=1 Tax=Anguilla anguilla TaxID=7936 RepID=A0A0E9W4Z0_ANGAN